MNLFPAKWNLTQLRNAATKLTLPATFFCAALFSANTYSDSGTPRYVAADGNDSLIVNSEHTANDCTNLFRPCQSVIYALNQSTKSDTVFVASGEHFIYNTEELFTVLANSYRLRGGYSRVSHYNSQAPEENSTTLIGVPADHREQFTELGFRIVSDVKHMSKDQRDQTSALSKVMLNTSQSHSATDCVNNSAANFPCGGVNLLSHIGLGELPLNANAGSDVWGFVDLNTMREYAIISLNTGVVIVDITDGESPYVISSHPGISNDWRDVKVYQKYNSELGRWTAYAYVTTEATLGLTIIDLSGLPNTTTASVDNSDITSAHNVYIAGVDYTFGAPLLDTPPTLTIAGAKNGGVNRVYSLTTPSAPALLNTAGSGYMHDGSSALITDARKNSQCINATESDACVIYADFNEDAVAVLDLTDPANPQTLSTTSYSGSEYVHSGWWSEDAQTLFLHDELDEYVLNQNTLVRAFDMSNLNSPQLIGNWQSSNRSIDHNGFVRGNRYYMSNYTAGLTILDITDPAQMERIGHFDTVPSSNNAQFSGAWGAYPFYPSHKIAISDINSGLYILEDNTLGSTAGSLRFSQARYSAEEGNNLIVSVERINGSTGDISVDVTLQHLTSQPTDTTFTHQTLAWTDGDTTTKTLEFSIVNDGLLEPLESAVMWLTTPTGSATLTEGGLAHITISDSARTPSIAPLANQSLGSSENPLRLVIQRKVSFAGESSADYSINLVTGSDSTVLSSGTLNWLDGDSQNKTVSLDSSSLTGLATANRLELVLSNVINAELEEESIVFTLNEDTSPPTNPDTPNTGNTQSSSGGGHTSLFLLTFIAALLLVPLRRRQI